VPVELVHKSDQKKVLALLEQSGLAYEEGAEATYGIYENGEFVATGSRAGNILKMLAIVPEHQGGAVFGELVTELVMSGLHAGHESLFVYTKPEYVSSFQALNFTLLANQEKVALLEYGKGLAKWLESKKELVRTGLNGAVVVNCNPFTNGHRYLIESAARQVNNLYVFVVKEDRSVFPFEVRYRLVEEGMRDLPNVIQLDTSRYIVSGATFPTYFLKKDDPVARIQMELDVTLFASKIAPYFGITRRFVGTEPNCPLTGGYNLTMQRILPAHGIELEIVERKQAQTGVISASKVRELVGRNDLTNLADFVPPTTLAYLQSDEAALIRERLQDDYQRKALTGC
jgi:[citrate (pro-3S)-lyase] ligase